MQISIPGQGASWQASRSSSRNPLSMATSFSMDVRGKKPETGFLVRITRQVVQVPMPSQECGISILCLSATSKTVLLVPIVTFSPGGLKRMDEVS